MAGQSFLFQAFTYLTAAVVSVPLAKRLGLGSALGYLMAGVAIGPFVLGLVGEEGQDVLHFAEFGVVMMLFLIGLELQPALLWRLRGEIVGLGGLQVVVTGVALAALGVAIGLDWRGALAAGLILALSSTAIALQTLQERGLLKTAGGRRSFAVLLFQDLAVIPLLALLPLLATSSGAAADQPHGAAGWAAGLPRWAGTLLVLGACAVIVVAGRWLVRPLFRFIARTHLPEVFTASALLLVIATALLMTEVGLSPALGTFLAGVVLATSEYRHELEVDIEPFKGLLLGLFFIAVGASIDFARIVAEPALVLGVVAALVVVKILVLLVLGRVFGLRLDQNLLFASVLAQGGEFAFVLFSFATGRGVLPLELTSPLVAAVALSMALTPLLMLANERVVQPRVGTREAEGRPADVVDEGSHVLIAGFGRFGTIVGRMLRANGVATTVLDVDSDQVETLRGMGQRVFYGDACRLDLLRSAGADGARVLVIAVDGSEQILRIAETARRHFPHLKIMARATSRSHAYELLDAGVDHVYRETFDSSLRVGVEALRLLGVPGYEAHRRGRLFRRHDERALREMAGLRGDRKAYLRRARESTEELERVLRADQEGLDPSLDAAWDAESLRLEYGGPAGDAGGDE